MLKSKKVLLLFFIVLSYFAARHAPEINPQLLHILFVGVLISYIPSLIPLRVRTYKTGTFILSRRIVYGMFLWVAYYLVFYIHGVNGYLLGKLDGGLSLLIGYLLLAWTLKFTDDDHYKSLIIVFVLAFSYYIVGFNPAAETAAALLYLLLTWIVLKRLVHDLKPS